MIYRVHQIVDFPSVDKIRIFFKDSWNDLISVSQDNLILDETENEFFIENNRCLAKKNLTVNDQKSNESPFHSLIELLIKVHFNR